MKRPCWFIAWLGLGCPTFAFSGMALIAQTESSPQRVLRFNEAQSIEAIGSCQVGADTVSCWNVDAVEDASLTEHVKKWLTKLGNRTVNFPGGDLLTIVRLTGGFTISLSAKGQNGNLPSGSLGGVEADTTGALVYSDTPRRAFQANTSEIVLDATISGMGTSVKQSIPAKVGAEAKFENSSLAIRDIRPAPAADLKIDPPYTTDYGGPWFSLMPWEKYWRYSFSYQGKAFDSGSNFVMFDKKGRRIDLVDCKGRPATREQAKRESDLLAKAGPHGFEGSGFGEKRNINRAACHRWSGVGAPGAFLVVSNVDPDQISKIEIQPTLTVKRELGPFLIPADQRLQKSGSTQ